MPGQDETDEDLLEFVGKESDPDYSKKVMMIAILAQKYQMPIPNVLNWTNQAGSSPRSTSKQLETQNPELFSKCQQFFTQYLTRKLKV